MRRIRRARLGVLAPMPITCALRRWKLPPSDSLAALQRRSRRARLGVLAPMPITCALQAWFLGAQCKRGGGCRTANAAVRLFGGTTSLRSATPTLPTRANRGVSRPAPAVPPRTCECIDHSTLFPGVLAPASITCALRLGDCPLRTDSLLLSAGRLRD